MKTYKKVRWNVLATISYVCEQTKGKQLKYEKTKKMQDALKRLSSYFGGVNENQVIILCGILDLHISKSDLCTIDRYFEMPAIQYLQHNDEIEDLDERGLLYVKITAEGHSYSLSRTILSSILRNQQIIFEKEDFDSTTFVRNVSSILRSHETEYYEKISCIQKLESKNENQPFIEQSISMLHVQSDRFMFYFICGDYLQNYNTEMMQFHTIYHNTTNTYKQINLMLAGKHALMKAGLVDFAIKGTVLGSTLTLTHTAKSILFGENESLYEAKLDDKFLIQPESIITKQLFYSNENRKQIDTLYSLDRKRTPALDSEQASVKRNAYWNLHSSLRCARNRQD